MGWKRVLDSTLSNIYLFIMTTIAEIREVAGRLEELVTQVQAGHTVLLTQDHKPVAKIVPANAPELAPGRPLQIRSLTGHRVLTPVISQAEIAETMLGEP